jgi:hypothetical protein
MSEKKDDSPILIFLKIYCVISAAICPSAIAGCSRNGSDHDKIQQQAVEHGYAEWRLTHAHNGETEFKWIDEPKTTETKP